MGSNINIFNFVPSISTPTVDPDAQAFITAASITDPTQQSAIDTLVTDLKGYGIWTKMKAIYPFVGGTATSHKFNLKDPRDLDTAFRLVFNGGGTHSSSGYLPNGTNAYANTYLNAQSNLTIDDVHLSYYSRTNNSANTSAEIGCISSSRYLHMHLYYTDAAITDKFLTLVNTNSVPQFSVGQSDGFFVGNKSATSVMKAYFNSVALTPLTVNNIALPSENIFIGGLNNSGSPSNYSIRECAFSSIGDSLTDTEASDFYTAVQAFNTTLSRQV